MFEFIWWTWAWLAAPSTIWMIPNWAIIMLIGAIDDAGIKLRMKWRR